MATNVYVDGPNLYYAALRDRPVRWLDLTTWCEQLLPDHNVKRVGMANPSRRGRVGSDKRTLVNFYLQPPPDSYAAALFAAEMADARGPSTDPNGDSRPTIGVTNPTEAEDPPLGRISGVYTAPQRVTGCSGVLPRTGPSPGARGHEDLRRARSANLSRAARISSAR